MQIKLYRAIQENNYYFKGYGKAEEIARIFSKNNFSEETLKKATIHRSVMEQGISPFTVTLRMEPETKKEVYEEETIFTGEVCQICNGASKIAALCQMKEEEINDGIITINLFLATEEKMKEIMG